MSCTCPQTVMTANGYSSYCGLPARVDGTANSVPYPDPCTEEPCSVNLVNAPDLTPVCPPACSPCTAPEPSPKDCDWSAEKMASTPPAIGCPPINVGWGQWDGGFKWWGGEKYPELLAACQQYNNVEYSQHAWHHILDLQQSPQWYSNLLVRRDGICEDINEMEFLTLAVRMAVLGQMLGVLPPPLIPAKLSTGVTQTGLDANGVPVFGFGVMYDGQPVGTPTPLVAHWDATGEPIGLTFPASLLPTLTVTP